VEAARLAEAEAEGLRLFLQAEAAEDLRLFLQAEAAEAEVAEAEEKRCIAARRRGRGIALPGVCCQMASAVSPFKVSKVALRVSVGTGAKMAGWYVGQRHLRDGRAKKSAFRGTSTSAFLTT